MGPLVRYVDRRPVFSVSVFGQGDEPLGDEVLDDPCQPWDLREQVRPVRAMRALLQDAEEAGFLRRVQQHALLLWGQLSGCASKM